MAKAGRTSQVGGGREASATRQRLVESAFEILRDDGFAKASARAIAARGEFNSALIFYYFDSVTDLLVEALAESSKTQLERYERALGRVSTVTELVRASEGLLRDDFDSGHVKVLTELVSASAGDPELRAKVLAQIQPWMVFAEETLERVLAPSGVTFLVPPEQVAFAVLALFLGMELLTGVGDDEFISDLFDSAGSLVDNLRSLAALAGIERIEPPSSDTVPEDGD
jgi:AcrR family transcriptional regulator